MRRLAAAFAAAGALFLSLGAQASEATLLADRAGFLVGHAQRCGVAEARLERSAAFIEKLIAAFAIDRDDRHAAEDQFTKRLLASAMAEQLDDPIPACKLVRTQLALFERHGDNRMVRSTRQPAQTQAGGGKAMARAPNAAAPTTTRSEELTPERRAALEVKRAAQRQRGRPPSI